MSFAFEFGVHFIFFLLQSLDFISKRTTTQNQVKAELWNEQNLGQAKSESAFIDSCYVQSSVLEPIQIFKRNSSLMWPWVLFIKSFYSSQMYRNIEFLHPLELDVVKWLASQMSSVTSK